MLEERHPKELPFLFMTEMWERFSFYLMLGILMLFMMDTQLGGLGFTIEKASAIMGSYIALVYLTPFIGGLIADRIIGYRKAIVLGGLLMCAGHFSLAFEGLGFFFTGLGLLILGNGFFKPNISTLLGRLYPEGSKLRDAGFNIFYFGINLGAFFCNFVAAILRNKYGWHAAFGSAGVGLAIGVVTFLMIYKQLQRAEIDTNRREKEGDTALKDLLQKVLPVSVLLAGIAYLIWKDTTAAFLLACVPVIGFYALLWHKSKAEEKGPIGALLTVSVILIPFWMVFQLYATVMTIWAEKNTIREVGPQAANILKEVDLFQHAPPSYFRNASPDTPRPDPTWLETVEENEATEAKKAYAERLGSGGDYRAAGRVPVTLQEFEVVYKDASGGPLLPPGGSLKLANAELFQSVNPFLVMVFTPLVLAFWGLLRRRGREPSTPAKIGVGILFGTAYMLVMLLAVAASNDGAIKLSALWLIGAYAVVTMGEMWLSPVGLSLVSKLAPKRLGAVMMGGFFLSISIGNKLSGYIGGLWEKVPHSAFFIVLALILLIFAIIIFLLTPWLRRYVPAEE